MLPCSLTNQSSLRDRLELLQIQPHHRIGEHPRILLRIALRDIDGIGFQNDGPDLPIFPVHLPDGSDRPVVPEAVLAADDAETGDSAVVVEDVESLGAGVCGEAGDDVHLPQAPDGHLAGLEAAGLDEVLVELGLVESAGHGPDPVRGRVDSLGEDRVALARGHGVRVVGVDDRLQELEFSSGQTRRDLGFFSFFFVVLR